MIFWVVHNSVHTEKFESKNSMVNYQMMNKKCNCKKEVSSGKLAVPIISSEKVALALMYNCFEKIGVLKK